MAAIGNPNAFRGIRNVPQAPQQMMGGMGPVSPFGMGGTVPQGSAAPLQAAGVLSGSPAANLIGNQYQSAYQTALANNQRQYADVLRGYQNTANQQYGGQQQIAGGMMGTLGQQMQGQNQVLGGYGNLGNQVQGYLGGMGQGLAGLQQAQQGIGQGYANLGGQVQGALQPMDTGLGQQQAQNARTQQGYTDLLGQVMGTIQGVDASQRQAIQDQYVAAQGQAGQSLASRGLGNTTVTDSVQRGLLYDKTKSDVNLSNQMAQLRAGYQSQLGLAGLGFATQANQMNTAQQNAIAGQRASYGSQLGQANLNYAQQASQQALAQQNLEAATRASYADQIGRQGLGYAGQAVANNASQRNAISAFGNQALAANTNLAQNQLGWMNSVSSPYPNAAMYAQLQNQAGSNQQGALFARQQAMAQAQQQAQAQRAMQQRQSPYQGSYGAEQSYGGGGGGGYGSQGNEGVQFPATARPFEGYGAPPDRGEPGTGDFSGGVGDDFVGPQPFMGPPQPDWRNAMPGVQGPFPPTPARGQVPAQVPAAQAQGQVQAGGPAGVVDFLRSDHPVAEALGRMFGQRGGAPAGPPSPSTWQQIQNFLRSNHPAAEGLGRIFGVR